MNEMPSALNALQQSTSGMSVFLEIVAVVLLGYIALQLSRVLSRLAQFSFIAREIHGEVAAQRKPEQLQTAIDESLKEIRALLKDNRETVRSLNERTSLLSSLSPAATPPQSPALATPNAQPQTPAARPNAAPNNAETPATVTLHVIPRDDDSRRKTIPG